MADLKQFEFFLLRYVPDAVKGEFVNFGVVLHELGVSDPGSSVVRITSDWRRLECMDRHADLEVLQGLGIELQRELDGGDWNSVIERLGDRCSNAIQLSPAQAVRANDSEAAARRLDNEYLRTHLPVSEGELSARRVIVTTIREAFKVAGILGFVQQNIRVADYTGKKGDPQRFDFAYPVGNDVRFVHALSLHTSLQPGLMLAARFPGIARDIHQKEGADAKLMVVLENDLDQQQEEIGFVLGMMADSQIRVAEVREMPRIAAEIRQELRA
jgi:Protein of unknown function (DUF3037)